MKKLIALIAVITLLSISIAIAGNAYGKAENGPCPRQCAKSCTGKDVGEAENIGVNECIISCLRLECGQAPAYGVCDAGPDGCCVLEANDPDCGTGEEICDNDDDDDGDNYVDEYCTPDKEHCDHNWECQSGTCDPDGNICG